MAQMAGPNIKVRWACEKLKGKYESIISKYVAVPDPLDDAKKKFELRQEKVLRNRGWMIYFPAGHSLHVTTEEDMKRLGFMEADGSLQKAGLVDMTTGLAVNLDNDPLQQLKRFVQGNVQRTMADVIGDIEPATA